MNNWHGDTFWEYTHTQSGHWIGVCDRLKMTLQCDTLEDLEDEIDGILTCDVIKALLEEQRFPVPINVLKKIYEATRTSTTSDPRRN